MVRSAKAGRNGVPETMKPNAKYIEYIEVAKLNSAKRNPRTHSKAQIKQIAGSITRFGFTNPVLIDDENRILAGHGRVAAAADLGIAEVPCLRLKHMSEADKRAYVIADNKLALNAGWDMEILASELGCLVELEFDMSLTGFEAAEIDLILVSADEASAQPAGREDQHPEPPAVGNTVTRLGDLWTLGRHRLVCGDAKDLTLVNLLMDGGKADMVFTDPPYNVPIAGHVSGLGRVRHREFAEASGELSPAQFTAFLSDSFIGLAQACSSGAIIFTCMDWRHLGEVLAAGHAAFDELKNMCVWVKTNAGMGTFYRSKHELVLAWKVGNAPHTNNFGLGDKGRYRTNVWTYPGVNTFKSDPLAELASHPTVKPVAMVADAIRDVSNRGEVVLDPFGGSGTTMIAAEMTGRSARLVELDPVYCDVIIRRWETFTGKQAVHAMTGDPFETLKHDRADAEASALVEMAS